MSIITFVKNLARNFKLRRVKEHLDSTRDEINNYTLPPLKLAAAEKGFKSKTYMLYADELKKTANHSVNNKNVFVTIYATLTNAQSYLNLVDKYLASTEFEEDITAAGLSLKQAHMLQLLDHISFFAQYSRRVADIIFTAEDAFERKEDNEVAGLTPADIDYMSAGKERFFKLINAFNHPADKFIEVINNLPDVTVSQVRNEAALSIHGPEALDTMQVGFNDSRWNPIWLIVSNIAAYQHNKYKLAKEEAAALELKIQRYKRQQQNNPDPKLESIIRNREAELDKMRAEIAKMEKV